MKQKKKQNRDSSIKIRVVTCVVDGKKSTIIGEYILAKTELLYIDPAQDFLEITLWTNWVLNECVVSILLYADFESGKTEIQKKYYNNKGVSNRRRFTSTRIKDSLLQRKIKINSFYSNFKNYF